jgi:hypothetical protein
MRGLSETESRDYILHRLRVAGAIRENIFHDNTFPVIYQYTGGIPRLINTLCDTALVCAFADGIVQITPAVLKTAIDELQWMPYTRRRKGQAVRGTVAVPDGAEQSRVLTSIDARLNQLDAMAPAVTLMSARMANIEAILRDIAKTLRSKQPAVVPLPQDVSRRGSK